MFYTVYKITNNVNKKIYIGVHKTEDLNDKYMGSGKLIKIAQKKYGLENFSKEYLAIFDNPEEMFDMESELVDSNFVVSNETYNLKEGGFGGWDFAQSLKSKEDFVRIAKLGRDAANRKMIEKYGTFNVWDIPGIKEKIISSNKTSKKYSTYKRPTGILHTEQSKMKIGLANSINQKGCKNSQFGTMWIHNPESGINKKISKDSPIEIGWIKGRKFPSATE